MTDIDIAALRALAENATPGPWRMDDDGWIENDDYDYVACVGEETADRAAPILYNRPADAEFIAALDPPTVIALLDELERRRAPDAETEWEYAIRADGDAEPYSDISTDLDWLCDDGAASGMERTDHLVRRRPAGPWVPVPEENPEPTAMNGEKP